VASALFLGKDVGGSIELGVRGDRTGLNNNLAALNIFTLGSTKE